MSEIDRNFPPRIELREPEALEAFPKDEKDDSEFVVYAHPIMINGYDTGYFFVTRIDGNKLVVSLDSFHWRGNGITLKKTDGHKLLFSDM